MNKRSNQICGDEGEKEIVKLIPCPNCGCSLMTLPRNYPLYDVQCTGCSFRSQVKTNQTSPKRVIFGAGWEIMNKVLKAGFMIPSLLVNFKWVEKEIPRQEIRFYPFVPKKNLNKRVLSPTARRANYAMFNYDLEDLPHFVLYKK